MSWLILRVGGRVRPTSQARPQTPLGHRARPGGGRAGTQTRAAGAGAVQPCSTVTRPPRALIWCPKLALELRARALGPSQSTPSSTMAILLEWTVRTPPGLSGKPSAPGRRGRGSGPHLLCQQPCSLGLQAVPRREFLLAAHPQEGHLCHVAEHPRPRLPKCRVAPTLCSSRGCDADLRVTAACSGFVS